jgi:UPF0176 protein
MIPYCVAAFYKFVPLPDFETLKFPLLDVMRAHNVWGTVILASEGINGTVAGYREDLTFFYEHLQKDPRLADLSFKKANSDFMPFEKAKVKFRKEIVTLGVPGVDPLRTTGERLSPEDWNRLMADPEVLVIDTRNTYEVELGTFKNAINPRTENFRDFPEYVKTELLDKKDKKIAMFCTGGIRCEKSTSYLKSLGFQEVYQLEGGILTYLENVPAEESQWEGKCFVFDERIAV